MKLQSPAGESVSARVSAPWVVAVANQKGGAGKTTITLGLASATADSSGKALVVDVDPQGSATEIAEEAGDRLPFDFVMDEDPARLARLRSIREYDSVFVDCPGNLDDTAVLREVIENADFGVIPFIPERQYVTPTRRTAAVFAAADKPYRVVVNAVDPLRGPKPLEDAWAMLDAWGLPRTRSFVRRYVAHSQSQMNAEMITQYKGDRSWKSALDDMRRLHTEILIELGRLTPGGGR